MGYTIHNKYLNDIGVFWLWRKILKEDEGVRTGIKIIPVTDENGELTGDLNLVSGFGTDHETINSTIHVDDYVLDGMLENVIITTPAELDMSISYKGKIYDKNTPGDKDKGFLKFIWNPEASKDPVYVLLNDINPFIITDRGSNSLPIYIDANSESKEITDLNLANGNITGKTITGESMTATTFNGYLNGTSKLSDQLVNKLTISNKPAVGPIFGVKQNYYFDGLAAASISFESYTDGEIDKLIENIK